MDRKKGERKMARENFVDDLEVQDMNDFYLRTSFISVIEDGHAVSSFNENKFNKKAYEVMDDYEKERYENLLVVDIE
ncbi:hypothetical protein [Sporanaerobacter acetigenes]|uniref:hypothetical protein n=1 Tax=Sporanaerobacter acetigenes TaxID=165813 RepID=UPI0033311A07